MSSFLGTTSRNIGNLFAFANRHRAILVLDRFDAIAKLRDDPNEVGEIKRVVNTLLQNLDERADKGLTIGITNHPQLLDPAVWRRFELQIQLPKPDLQTRASIAERYAQPLRFTRGQLKLVASILEGASGAEILDVVRSLKKSWILEGSNVCLRIGYKCYIHSRSQSASSCGGDGQRPCAISSMLHERYAFTL
jgi:SpoVK/Ycf46/Vps4 family AAA+-type ATPase